MQEYCGMQTGFHLHSRRSNNSHELIAGDDICCLGQSLAVWTGPLETPAMQFSSSTSNTAQWLHPKSTLLLCLACHRNVTPGVPAVASSYTPDGCSFMLDDGIRQAHASGRFVLECITLDEA